MQSESSAELFTKKDKRMQPGFLSAAAMHTAASSIQTARAEVSSQNFLCPGFSRFCPDNVQYPCSTADFLWVVNFLFILISFCCLSQLYPPCMQPRGSRSRGTRCCDRRSVQLYPRCSFLSPSPVYRSLCQVYLWKVYPAYPVHPDYPARAVCFLL